MGRLKLKGSRPPLPRCGACGGRIPKAMYRKALRDGREICGRCVARGVLFQPLACGHYGVPGMTVAGDSADLKNMMCAACSPLIDEKALRPAEKPVVTGMR